MANLFTSISTYQVLEYGGPKGAELQGATGIRAIIVLVGANLTAYLSFFADNAAIPNLSSANTASGQQQCYVGYPYSQYAGVIDLLRNEKPISFFFNEANGVAYVTTSTEPVGEGENTRPTT